MENLQSGVNPNQIKSTFVGEKKEILNLHCLLISSYTKHNRLCPLLLHTWCGTDRIIAEASDVQEETQSAPQGIFWFFCTNTSWATFVSVRISSQNWTGIRLQSVQHENLTVALQQVCFPSSPTPSLIFLLSKSTFPPGVTQIQVSVTRYLTRKQTAKGQKRALAKFQFRLAAPSLAT